MTLFNSPEDLAAVSAFEQARLDLRQKIKAARLKEPGEESVLAAAQLELAAAIKEYDAAKRNAALERLAAVADNIEEAASFGALLNVLLDRLLDEAACVALCALKSSGRYERRTKLRRKTRMVFA